MGVGTAGNVSMGPGTIYVAPLGTAEPTSATSALDVAYRAVGYTESGSIFQFGITAESVFVAEEFYPVAVKTTQVEEQVGFEMAEATQQNLALALNAGASAGASASFEPVSPGSEIRVIIVVDKENGARWLFRRCFQGGSMELRNQKAPNKTLLPVQFRLEKPDAAQPWKVFKALTPVAGLV